jgi:rod shape-determining protein MreC
VLRYKKNATKSRIKDLYSKLEKYIFIILSAIIIHFSLSYEKNFSPFYYGVTKISTKISNTILSPFYFTKFIFNEVNIVIDLKRNYEILKSEKEVLQNSLFVQQKIKRENTKLKSLLKFVDNSQDLIVTTKIIHQPNPIYNQKIIIESGKNQDVNKYDVVVYKNKLIGRVIKVDDNVSEVLLITDKKSHIPVISNISNEKGILRGTGESNIFEVIFYNKNHNMDIGELFLSASDGGFIPEGMIIGKITEIKKKSIIIQSSNNLKNIEFVQVFTRKNLQSDR